MLIYAIIFITSALVFYTIGVWSEKIQGTLKLWHLIFFLLGLICDTTGTYLMGQIASSGNIGINFHAITGGLAIILMLIHAIWAGIVLAKKNTKMMINFHKFSIIVWIIWLIPFLSGALVHVA
ncbi:HsmA family protein [Clostridium fallax]|uniref:TIGR03987 family protein n=1 Tax=Clostridium fallax TaxID=1533 RepID=A0A1M4T5N1_9CLOT|nr:HsmA family protein [Clostridium fallax]SHE39627.1 TIGR03987 family protein [Clostridium fallax]SQB22603.1 Uncharacterised protein [Clostridium fallax]